MRHLNVVDDDSDDDSDDDADDGDNDPWRQNRLIHEVGVIG